METTLKNDLLLQAARGEKTDRTPVWLMRQAGRILPEYRAVREKMGSFINLVKTPERAAEVSLQPVDILGVDAAIIFSDILVIPEAMGLPYEMAEKRGPWFPKTIKTKEDIQKLVSDQSEDRLSYVMEALKIAKKELDGRVPLIGFAGAPFTIYCYMVEGSGSKTFSNAKAMLYREPETAKMLLQKITDATIDYLKAQTRAGADLLQLFDSWAGVLSPRDYSEFALPYIKQICDAVTETPKTVFAKGAFWAREDFAKINCNVIGLDWTMDATESRAIIGDRKTLQGNLDPCALYGSFKDVERETKKMMDGFKGTPHIANLGHGVYPDVDPEKVKCFVEAVKAYH